MVGIKPVHSLRRFNLQMMLTQGKEKVSSEYLDPSLPETIYLDFLVPKPIYYLLLRERSDG